MNTLAELNLLVEQWDRQDNDRRILLRPRPSARPTATPRARALISVLLLHRHMAHEDVVAGIAAALKAGALTADAVALEARPR